jgi:DNA repair protein RadC
MPPVFCGTVAHQEGTLKMSSCQRNGRAGAPRPGQPINGPLAAMEVVMLAVSQPHRPETIVLCLDHAHRGSTIIVVDHPSREPVEEIAEMMFQISTAAAGFGAMVLATVRPGPGVAVVPADELAWFELRAGAEATGLELLDWFVVSDDHVVSMCTFTDTRPLWHRADDL